MQFPKMSEELQSGGWVCGEVPFHDITQYAESCSGVWDLEFQQLGASIENCRCRYVSDGGALLYEETYPADIGLRGTVSAGSIAFVITNRYGESGRWQGGDCPPHCVAYAASGKEVDVLLPRSTGNLAVVLPLAAFRAEFERLVGEPMEKVLPPDRLFLVLGPESHQRLRSTWLRLLREGRRAGSLRQRLVESLASACVQGVGRLEENGRCSRETFRRAMELCRDGETPVGLAELALELGVSLRTVELAFRSCMEVPPARYLRWLRLNRAHGDLSRQDPHETTVTRIAMDLGFTELGRFAGEYRKMFGESPSETLKRRMRSAPPLPAIR